MLTLRLTSMTAMKSSSFMRSIRVSFCSVEAQACQRRQKIYHFFRGMFPGPRAKRALTAHLLQESRSRFQGSFFIWVSGLGIFTVMPALLTRMETCSPSMKALASLNMAWTSALFEVSALMAIALAPLFRFQDLGLGTRGV